MIRLAELAQSWQSGQSLTKRQVTGMLLVFIADDRPEICRGEESPNTAYSRALQTRPALPQGRVSRLRSRLYENGSG